MPVSLSLRNPVVLAVLGLVATTLFWGGNAVVARATSEWFPPFTLSFLRWVLALLIILPFAWGQIRAYRNTIRRHWRILWVLAALSVGLFNTLLYLAAQFTTATNITLVNSTMPVVIGLMALLFFGQRPRSHELLGIVLAFLGVLAIVSQGDREVLLNLELNPGDLVMLLAVCCWGLYSLLLKRYGPDIPAVPMLAVMVAMGIPVIVPFLVWELIMVGPVQGTVMEMLPPLIYVGIFPSLLAYLFWNNGVHVLGPARTALFIYLVPVFGSALAILFLGERLEPYHGVGAAAILAGLYVATRGLPGRRPVEEEHP
ncbi:DMT family transporter [Alkalilimnicola ehrlichii]|uniref:DMT family transporter n=1 Tax=Alkalilimnicola ehrlichii TaxID=351052 RepID=UPI003BA33246